MVTVSGTVKELKVNESSRTGSVLMNAPPPNGPFKIANNSDTGFGAMVAILASAKASNKPVSLEVGSGDELDEVTFL